MWVRADFSTPRCISRHQQPTRDTHKKTPTRDQLRYIFWPFLASKGGQKMYGLNTQPHTRPRPSRTHPATCKYHHTHPDEIENTQTLVSLFPQISCATCDQRREHQHSKAAEYRALTPWANYIPARHPYPVLRAPDFTSYFSVVIFLCIPDGWDLNT